MRLHKKPLNKLASLKDEQILENIAFLVIKVFKTPLTSQQAFWHWHIGYFNTD
ncbi:hypothetical protein VN0798_09930 [Helicobacter pylori]